MLLHFLCWNIRGNQLIDERHLVIPGAQHRDNAESLVLILGLRQAGPDNPDRGVGFKLIQVMVTESWHAVVNKSGKQVRRGGIPKRLDLTVVAQLI